MYHSEDAQLILVMNELDAINFCKKGYEKPGCKVIAFDSEFLAPEDPLIAHLKNEHLLVENNVLVKNPNSSDVRYYLLEDASRQIHTDYFKQYAKIMGLLGATSVSVEECSVIEEKSSVGGSAEVGINGLGGKGSGQSTGNSNVQAIMKLKETFEPNFNLSQAKKLIEDFSLQNNRELSDFVKAVEAGTRQKDYEFDLELSQKLQKVFNLAASINPYAGIDIKATIDRKKDIVESYKLHVRVEFNNSQTN